MMMLPLLLTLTSIHLTIEFEFVNKSLNEVTIVNGHLMINKTDKFICDIEIVKNISIEIFKDLEALSKGASAIAKAVKENTKAIKMNFKKTNSHYTQSHQLYMKISNKMSYEAAIEFCDAIEGQIVQIKDPYTFNAARNLLPPNSRIWQEITKIHDHTIFVIGGTPIPSRIDNHETLGNMQETGSSCGSFDFSTNRFSFIPCSDRLMTICIQKLNSQEIMNTLIKLVNIQQSVHELNKAVEEFKNIFKSLPGSSGPLPKNKFALLSPRERDVVLNIDKVSDSVSSKLASQVTEFLHYERIKIDSVTNGLKNITTLKAQFDECCDNLFDAIFSSPSDSTLQLMSPKQSEDNLLLQASNVTNCRTVRMVELHPLYNTSHPPTKGTFAIQNKTCIIADPNCLTDTCPNSFVKTDQCCTDITSENTSTTEACNRTDSVTNLIVRNSTHWLINSVNPITLNWKCSNTTMELNTFIGKILTSENCQIISNFYNFPIFSNIFIFDQISTFFEVDPSGSPPPSGSEESIVNKILTYAAFLASVCTILMFIISIYLFYSRRKRSASSVISQNDNISAANIEQNIPMSDNISAANIEQNIPTRSILKNKQKKKKKRYSSTDSDDSRN